MSVYVFVGPTLPVEEARREFDATYCPPAAVGDVYRAACRHPVAIGIIDGFFERLPSVWHKEILWAMSEGVHVFGAASMGALRAAELGAYGMEGVGQVFTSFRDGQLHDDDEVAVAHAPAESGYRLLSDAMVNIRSTLTGAAASIVISETTRAALERIAKRMFYAERTYDGLIAAATAAGLAVSELAALRDWLPSGRADVKRADAFAMLRLMRDRFAAGIAPKKVSYSFEHTHAWEVLQRKLRGRKNDEEDASLAGEEDAVFDELRLRGTFIGARRAALGRLLALAEARESAKPFPSEALHESAVALRRERGLFGVEEFRAWLADNGLTPATLDGFLRDEARIRWVDATLANASTRCLADQLRVAGEYAEPRARALEKQEALRARGIDPDAVGLPEGLADSDLWTWYFVDWLGHPRVPSDIVAYAEGAGFTDVGAFRRAVLREYLTQ